VLWSLGLWLLLAGRPAQGQEALRMSVASAEAAEARRKAAATLGYYNLKLGPTAWNFQAGTAIIYSDNINYASQSAEADVVFRPQIETHVLWPVSTVNSLTLTLGAGYSAYVRHSELDRFFLVPGSETSFDIYSGDFWINLHDRFSITDNAFQDPTYAGTGDYQRLENTLGVAATWDLNKIILKAGYDHLNYSALSGRYLRVRDEQSELLTMSGSYALRPEMRLGLELSGGLTAYSWETNTPTTMTLHGDGRQWSAGLPALMAASLWPIASTNTSIMGCRAAGRSSSTLIPASWMSINCSGRRTGISCAKSPSAPHSPINTELNPRMGLKLLTGSVRE
jgi:hypothetical protein